MRKFLIVFFGTVVILLGVKPDLIVTLAYAETNDTYKKLLLETKVRIGVTGIKLDSPFCNPQHPNRDAFITGFAEKDPEGAVKLCLMQYAGVLALKNQELQRIIRESQERIRTLERGGAILTTENGALRVVNQKQARDLAQARAREASILADLKTHQGKMAVVKSELEQFKKAGISTYAMWVFAGMATLIAVIVISLAFLWHRRPQAQA